MNAVQLSVAKDFSVTPGGRYKKEGKYSGEEFREKLLDPSYLIALESNKILVVDLDGCFGFPSSFIDESFGGLARKYKGKHAYRLIKIISNDQPGLVEEIAKIMQAGDK